MMTVVIPTYNEERRIAGSVRAIHAYMSRTASPFDVLISDDGSTDRTGLVVSRLAQDGVPVRFLPAPQHRGKGWAVRRGVMAARGDLILITDADLSTPISEITRLLGAINSGADIAIGSRGMPGSRLVVRQPLYREYSGKLFNCFVRALLLPTFRDTQCGFKLMRGTVARLLFSQCRIDSFACDVEVLALAARAGFVVVEVPVAWAHNADTKVSLARDSFRMLWDLVRISARMWRRQPTGAREQIPAGGADDWSV